MDLRHVFTVVPLQRYATPFERRRLCYEDTMHPTAVCERLALCFALAPLFYACGPAAEVQNPPSLTAPISAPAPAAPPTESPACSVARKGILADMARSRSDRSCVDDADCRTVMNPGSATQDYRQVVHTKDASELDERANKHLVACGEFIHHEDIGAFVFVEATCSETRCQASETSFHEEQASSRRPSR